MAKKKSKSDEKEYTATVNLSNGATGKDYEPGDTVKAGDFPAAIIKGWLERGHLEVKDDNG
jgi:hypothetical protein